jgi:anti-anti-sigma regulatory factor
MSVGSLQTLVDGTIDHTGAIITFHLRGAVVVRRAAAVRQAVSELLETADPGQQVVIDLTAVDELDAAGLAAVTSPVLRACRTGRTVSVVPPIAAAPLRLADQVGVLPIGAG